MNYICNCLKTNYLDHNYTYWENRQITSDEFEIINFLEKSYDLRAKSILHIGIGNSFFAKKFFKNQIFGIPISQKEIDLAYCAMDLKGNIKNMIPPKLTFRITVIIQKMIKLKVPYIKYCRPLMKILSWNLSIMINKQLKVI